ncbi:MAG: shikimate kinase [Anaerotruncus sp.]|nr:shikimate kinase [Anaerotruncus sp.]
MYNLLLCGFMGCGKTTVGRLLASQLSMEYIDLDAQIEQDAQIRIPDIFAQYGEAYFRDLEHEAICALARRISCIVSTGGGAMTFSRNVQAVDAKDRVLFLDASFESCYVRIQNSDRPLVRNNTKEQLQTIYQTRHAAYQKAASIRVCADGTPAQIAAQIRQLCNL